MTDECEERRKDDMRVLERLSKVEVKVDTNCDAVRRLEAKLVDHVVREEEQANSREERMMARFDLIYDEIRALKAIEQQRKGKQALLAGLGAGVIAIGAILIQLLGFWKG